MFLVAKFVNVNIIECNLLSFRVEIQHGGRGGMSGDVSWTKNLTVFIAGARLDLLQGRRVLVSTTSRDCGWF